ncbi:MAG: BrnT family toxin [Anaerolineales bacterium]|nr:BrnT family toxin [Anaerolineales bacterium]
MFGDPLAITFDDPDHSESEQRHLTFGLSLKGRLIVVSHTERGNRTRIINARPMSREETGIYEEG